MAKRISKRVHKTDAQPATDGRQAKGRVLVSGSQNDSRFMMRVLLEMWGFEVIEANGAAETVAAAETFSPSVVLVDTSRMFDEEIEIVTSLRDSKLPAGVPVLVMSGFSQAAYAQAAVERGATELLVKPLDLGRLEEFLESSLPA